MPLEILDFSFVFFSCLARWERAEIPPLGGPGIFFTRIQPIHPRPEFPYHADPSPKVTGYFCFNKKTPPATEIKIVQ